MTDPQSPIMPAPAYPAEQPPAPQGTNTLAIVALIGSFFVSLVGIICGHIALSQIKKTGQKGRGMALAGTIIGYVGLVAGIIAMILFFTLGIFAVNSVATKASDCKTVSTALTTLGTSMSDAFSSADALTTGPDALKKATDEFKADTAKVADSKVSAAVNGLESDLESLNAALTKLVADQTDSAAADDFQNSLKDVQQSMLDVGTACTLTTGK